MEAACVTENVYQPSIKVRWIRVIKEKNLNHHQPKRESAAEFKGRTNLLADSTSRKDRARKNEDHKNTSPPEYVRDRSGKVYHFGRMIGKGGYSRCYYVSDENGDAFAAKSLFLPPTPSMSTLLRIERESCIHERLHHPYIVKFHQIIQEEARVFLILDYCANSTLSDLVNKKGRLREAEARQLVVPIFDAVNYLHSIFIHHGDLKMSNIFLDRNMAPKVGDFGFAKQFKTATQTRTNLCGTPAYMAPEILEKPCVFGLPADVWSLGVITFALLHGFTAFDAKSIEAVQARIRSYDLRFPPVSPSLSDECIDLIKAMLYRSPPQRITITKVLRHSWLHRRIPRCEPIPELSSGSEDVFGEPHTSSQRKKLKLVQLCKPSYLKSFMSKRLRLLSRTKSNDDA